MDRSIWSSITVALLGVALTGCGDSSGGGVETVAETCMTCHNGSQENDYAGPGLENPHPFGPAQPMKCTVCHGGNPKGEEALTAHVPPPPEIGDDEQMEDDPTAYFNRLTLTGIDKFDDYTVGGKTYTALDYLQFINPGDLRVVTQGQSCGQCHDPHADSVANSLLATEAGVFGGAMYSIGVDNEVPASQGLYQDTAADLGFRAAQDNGFSLTAEVGPVSELYEYPVMSQFGVEGPGQLFKSDEYKSEDLPAGLNPDNSVISGSPLADLFHEQVAFTCGDCHLGSAGANNRYGDFRSSGCTSCHMPYSLDGRSTTGDPNVNLLEPLDPDEIEAPERAHPKRHLIQSIAKTLPSGEHVQGINDYACAGCHQGSNRTVMQYWGIRLDQNEDVDDGFQYPANPVSYTTTKNDERLFDPVVDNNTFNGRRHQQYLLMEDYDGDGLDDTPPDVHYEAGMGCIDCHGSFDLHGGNVNDDKILSRMEHGVAIRCEDCHGTVDEYAPTKLGKTYDGDTLQLAMDSQGNVLPHVYVDSLGDYYMKSRLTGETHYVSQTKDTVHDNGKTNPLNGEVIYSDKASFAMGRHDGDDSTGTGPVQTGFALSPNFAHGDNMSCASCHAAWTNTCIGCHLEGEYNTNPNNISNITGERIVFRERNADFVYQSPVLFQLGVGPDDEIDPIIPNTETFFRYLDKDDVWSDTFEFTDRNGGGANKLDTPYPSLAHNVMMPHSIRGKIDFETGNEGPRYCVSCHLTDDALNDWGTEYDAFRTAIQTADFGALDFDLLQEHIGLNPGNQLNSPFFVHMASGLGTGLFLFDDNGCPENPLDQEPNRAGCDAHEGVAPATHFDPDNVAYDLDRIVNELGESTGSNSHPMVNPDPALREDEADSGMSGPLGRTLIERLSHPTLGIRLDSWLNADGTPEGGASGFVDDTP
ncbi:MAG: hypothetical protein AAF682_03085 [Planctomycetota bacterium]